MQPHFVRNTETRHSLRSRVVQFATSSIIPNGTEEERADANKRHTVRIMNSIFGVNFARADARQRCGALSRSFSIGAPALQEKTGFQSEREHVCGRPRALRRCG